MRLAAIIRSRGVVGVVVLGSVLLATPSAPASPRSVAPRDGLRAVDAVPPGESGNTTLPQFAAVTAGLASSYGPHTDDQQSMYASFRDKSMSFHSGPGTAPPGDPDARIWRDSYGVPTIAAPNEADLFYAIGYAMAQDRLAQMEVLRHVGHGTLADLIGASGIAMDKAVRRYTEGDAALRREFDAEPHSAQVRLLRFSDGVNEWIRQVQGPQIAQLPAEFTLLAALPIKPWTVLDTLGFGEYAGRFFGEFGHGELQDAATYRRLVAKYGTRMGRKMFNDLLPLNDPHAPTSITPSDGRFPRHTSSRVGSSPARYVNEKATAARDDHDLPRLARTADRTARRVSALQRLLAIPRLGSNAIAVSGRLTTDGHPLLYGGPQTGWAVPGFFWEVEVHDPARDQRGVMLPGLPLIVIGRNATSAWTVTSALDANADTFVMRLNASDTRYRYRGKWWPLHKKTETIACSTPPSAATSVLSSQLPELCPQQPASITVYRTVLGPAVAAPDADHRLYVRHAAEDGRIASSFVAWDRASRATSVRQMSHALRGIAFGFNFLYVDDHGRIGYWHVGRYPIRPANVDPRLPIPGSGRYDWTGFERFRDQPHVIDPKSGYVVNWNNEPATGWGSKNLQVSSDEGGEWGDSWESVSLQKALVARLPLSFASLYRVPEAVAYVDNQARLLKPYLVRALAGTKNARLRQVRRMLRGWDGRRNHVNGSGGYSTPAIAFFDRFIVRASADLSLPALGHTFNLNSGLACDPTHPTCKYHSVDNEAAPTYKFEYATEQLLLAALRRHVSATWLRAAAGSRALLVRAARQTVADLTKTQGRRISGWNEPVETGEFSAQGAISVPPLVPLPNKGSFTMLVEATRSPVASPHGRRR
ncbi:MAG TPA: penicillin acylase family protein [Mycobacteriales bacterium]|nr:penicillin acylase family protein [Mycobacteriales bacterium]